MPISKELKMLSSVAHPFTCLRVKSGKLIWHDKDSEQIERRSDAEIISSWCLSTGKGDVVGDLELLDNEEVNLVGERYGGTGMGGNGGGVRSGNVGSVQLKGIGNNGLGGTDVEKLHFYGGLSLEEGAYEVIASKIYGKLLPRGVVPCVALIATGERGAYVCRNDSEPEIGTGAVLVREQCMRPAHLFRAPTYYNWAEDVIRVRAACLEYVSKFTSLGDLVGQAWSFLRACASQFGYARVHKIVHGAMSPSNISLDGRWLDLSTSTFCQDVEHPYHKNTRCQLFFEAMTPTSYIDELFYNINKYVGLKLNPDILLTRYSEAFDAANENYLYELFGITEASEISKNLFSKVHRAYNSMIMMDAKTSREPANHARCFLEAYASLFTTRKLSAEVERSVPKSAVEALDMFFNQLRGESQDNSKLGVISCLRQEYFRPVFARENIIANI